MKIIAPLFVIFAIATLLVSATWAALDVGGADLYADRGGPNCTAAQTELERAQAAFNARLLQGADGQHREHRGDLHVLEWAQAMIDRGDEALCAKLLMSLQKIQ